VVEQAVERRLAAILAADVVGYSRLMGHDEDGTLAALRKIRTEVVDPKISEHKGRIFKTTGDGFLVDFPSVVNAVACAVDIQKAMAVRNADLPENRLIQFRIGVNLGDVIIEGEDVFGDGVNVAARLEGIAPPGDVVVSGAARDQIGNRLDLQFEDLGEQKLKNIERPVRLYRVDTIGNSAPGAIEKWGSNRRNWQVLAVSAILLVLATGSVVFWIDTHRGSSLPIEVASIAKMELPLPDKPSIAVLPFTNMSSEAGQENFADGMTDNLITDLSKVSGLFVIARNSTFVYRGRPVKISQVAEELGVRYVLEGSVQRAGQKIRVNAQLIDALTGGHVWADRFDGDITDVFAVQDEFIQKIVNALEVNLTPGEKQEIASDKTESVAAKEAFDQGWSLYLRYNPKDNASAISAFKKAVEHDPEYGRAYAALSLAYFRYLNSQWFVDSGASWPSILAEALRYLELAKKYPTALSHVLEAMDHAYRGQAQEARGEAGRAIALDPNDPEAHIAMAIALTISGQAEEALDFVAAATRINPAYPSHYALAKGLALITVGRLEEATRTLEDGLKQNPKAFELYLPLVSSLAQVGRREEARRVLLKWWPGADQRQLENLADTVFFAIQWDNAYRAVRERLFDGLRLASLPSDVTISSLVTTLETGRPFDQIAAARRLGWFGPAAVEAVPALIDALENEYLRKDSVQSLGKIGPLARAAIPALTVLQNESLIGSYAKEALKNIRVE
jgi:adenylate cyclase